MQGDSPRRFRLVDALVFIAVIALGLFLIRTGVSMRVAVFTVTPWNEPRAPIFVQMSDYLWLFEVGGGCILVGLLPAVLFLGLHRAHPSRWEAAQGPGLATCIVALAASILPMPWYPLRILHRREWDEYPFVYWDSFYRAIEMWVAWTGPLVMGAWIVLILQGRWRPRPTWTDRAGCLFAVYFVVLCVWHAAMEEYRELYFSNR